MSRGVWNCAAVGLLVAVALAVFVSPHASTSPDGLERVAADQGFLEQGAGAPFWRHALMPDYIFRTLGDGPAATAAAGLIGTLCAFAAGYVAARLIRARGKAVPAESGPREGPRP